MDCTKKLPLPQRTLELMARIDEMYYERIARGEIPYDEIPVQWREGLRDILKPST